MPGLARKRRAGSVRGISIHRSYTPDEIARAQNVHKNTVLRWLKNGLESVDGRRPYLVTGRSLLAFLNGRKARGRRCGLDEAYCFRCRAPQPFAGRMADLETDGRPGGMLTALCETCDGTMHKRVGAAQIAPLRALVDLTIQPGRGVGKSLAHSPARPAPSAKTINAPNSDQLDMPTLKEGAKAR